MIEAVSVRSEAFEKAENEESTITSIFNVSLTR
jgi:hypothetical protein